MQLSVRSFSQQTTKLIDAGRLDEALRAIHDFVERIVSEPLCTAVVFGSATLDDLCRRVGARSLRELEVQASPATGSRPTIVYIVTKLQKSGGHSRVLDDLIRAEPEASHVILSTELAGRSDAVSLGVSAPAELSITQESAPRESFVARLKWLQRRLLELAPRKVYLFNHHQDSIAVAAMPPELGLETWYYHHADHHLALGVLSPHFKHIDPHPMGYDNCRNHLGIENLFVPLTFDDRGMRSGETPFRSGGSLTTCTAARSNKLELPYMIGYGDVITSLLGATRGTHIHIGRLTPWMLLRLRRKLRSAGIEPERFVYVPWVASVWQTLQQRQVDLYINSFPYGGGLTLIEAMGSGTPIAAHKHVMSRILTGFDLAHSEALIWRDPQELIDYCRNATPEILAAQSLAGRAHYERFHHRDRLSEALSDVGRLQPPPLDPAEFQIQADEWAIWMEQRVSLRAVVHRKLYRLFKRMRARFG